MSIVASRYARAFADAVTAASLDIADVDRQLADFAFAWDESQPLRHVFEDPSFSTQEKVAILDKLNVSIGLSPLVRNFIAVLLEHDRIGIFDEVVAAYRTEIGRRQGVYDAEIVSARPLADDERGGLEAEVAKLAGGQVRVKYREDGALLGGVVVTIGSTVYDGSVRGRLERLKEELVAG